VRGSRDPVPTAAAPIASARPAPELARPAPSALSPADIDAAGLARWAPRRIRADVLAAARARATWVRVVAARAASRADVVGCQVRATGREIVRYGSALVHAAAMRVAASADEAAAKVRARVRAGVLAAARARATWVRLVAGRAASRAGVVGDRLRVTGRDVVRRGSALVHTAARRVAAGADGAAAKVRAGARLVAERIARAARQPMEAWAPRAPRRAILLAAAALFAVGVAASWSLRWLLSGPAPVATVAPPAPAVSAAPVPDASVRLHVNARPWARIRVDGVDVGPTPLSHLRVEPGPHDFEAVFPDGRVVRRRVEVGPDQRFVTFR
jgi:hypothetical protein